MTGAHRRQGNEPCRGDTDPADRDGGRAGGVAGGVPPGAARGAWRGARRAARAARPPAHLLLPLLGISTLLLALGLVMVLSASSVQMLSQGDSPFLEFQKQVFGVALGVPLMWVRVQAPAARVPVSSPIR